MGRIGRINASNLATCERLQRLLTYLQDREGVWATSKTIRRETGIEVPHSAIAELRANGAVVSCEMRDISGKKRWAYRLDKSPEMET